MFSLFFFFSFFLEFSLKNKKVFTFGQVKGNARDGRSRHRPTKASEFVKLISTGCSSTAQNKD